MPRPFVYINMAMTADGKITSAAREYPRFTSAADRKLMDRLRAEADAVVVGAGTLRADDPPLHVRDAEMQAYRDSLGKSGPPLRVVVTASGSIETSRRFFSDEEGGGRIVATVETLDPERVAALRARAEVWQLGREEVDLSRLLDRLGGCGARRVLLEGGGDLNWRFVRDGLADELYVTIAPALLGGREAPTLLEGRGFAMASQRKLRLLELRRKGDEIFCRYSLVRG
jgi:2,5-diamino-6-(ribosylamino)-4(3H)-pyrimidinone 5'-phosphate reductase